MNLEISSINAFKCRTLSYMPNASELVREWMHENSKNQAQLMRDLKLQNHQKLSMFLRGKTRQPDFLHDLAVLMGRASEVDYKRFKEGLPAQPLPAQLMSQPLVPPNASPSKERNFRLADQGTQTLALVDWSNLLDTVLKPNDVLSNFPRAPVLRSCESGTKTKAVRVHDNSMDPELLMGDVAVFDPDSAYGDGDIVLVRMRDGTHAMRRFTALADTSFDVTSTRPAQTWNSVKHGIVVLARVICVYREMPSRVRAQPPR